MTQPFSIGSLRSSPQVQGVNHGSDFSDARDLKNVRVAKNTRGKYFEGGYKRGLSIES